MPEISPELAARIETLKASHAENPARFFMPLASAYREAGEVGKAEELLRDNLKRHPGYLSAHVLLGRCLADRGAYAEARNEFQYVLSVDGQNLIALRTLGDMAAQGGDVGEARRWYGELLSVDPMNTEARQSLAGLEHLPAAPASPPPAEEQGGFGMVEIAPHAAEAELPHAGHDDPGAWGAISLDGPSAEPAGAASSSSDDGGFDALDFGAVDLDVPVEPAPAAPEPAGEVPAAPTFETAESAGGFDAWGSVDDAQLDIDDGGVEPLPLENFYEDEPAPAAAHHDDHEDHGEVVTETIAELYAQQGFPDRAAEVYRELITRRGEEPALVRRLAELEARTGAAQEPAEAGGAGGFEEFGAIDLDVPTPGLPPADFTPAPTELGEAPAWLESVDSFLSAGSAGPPATADAGAAEGEGDLDLPEGGDLDLPYLDTGDATSGAPSAGEPSHAHAHVGAATGDAFADSFAGGFDGAARAEWRAPTVEETEPAAEIGQSLAAAAPLDFAPVDASASEPSLPAAEPVDFGASEDFGAPAESATASPGDSFAGVAGDSAEGSTESVDVPADASTDGSVSAGTPRSPGGETISAYLGAILSWRPGAAAETPAAPAPSAESNAPTGDAAVAVEDAGAPPPARPWDDETLGAPEQQPPMDEPWIADPSSSASAADAAPPADEPWAASADTAPSPDAGPAAGAEPAGDPWAAPAAEPASADEPWAAPAGADAGDEPWSQGGVAAEDDAEDLPWMSTEAVQPDAPAQGTEPAAGGPSAGAAPMPWEASFDLSPEVPAEPTADRAPPRQEPAVEPAASGFSFEDFFNEQAAVPPEPQPAPAPEPAPAFEPVAPPPAPAAPAQPQGQQGGDDDEDLESFQAWLQSLKR